MVILVGSFPANKMSDQCRKGRARKEGLSKWGVLPIPACVLIGSMHRPNYFAPLPLSGKWLRLAAVIEALEVLLE